MENQIEREKILKFLEKWVSETDIFPANQKEEILQKIPSFSNQEIEDLWTIYKKNEQEKKAEEIKKRKMFNLIKIGSVVAVILIFVVSIKFIKNSKRERFIEFSSEMFCDQEYQDFMKIIFDDSYDQQKIFKESLKIGPKMKKMANKYNFEMEEIQKFAEKYRGNSDINLDILEKSSEKCGFTGEEFGESFLDISSSIF